jgi:molecular chaperone GrpE
MIPHREEAFMPNPNRSHQYFAEVSQDDGVPPEDGSPATKAEPIGRDLTAENATLRDQLLRALADVDNTRRHAERSATDARKYAVGEFAREMLGVSDSLHRAIAAATDPRRNDGDASLIEGVRATEKMLTNIFERFGLRKIDALGAPFDPNFHEAMMEVDDAFARAGTVAAVLEDGYTIHDRLVRPARVTVVRRRSNSLKDKVGDLVSEDDQRQQSDEPPSR